MTWNEKYKSRNDLFWRHHPNQRLEELYNAEHLKENPCIPRKSLPNYNGKEKEIMQNKRKGTCRITITKY